MQELVASPRTPGHTAGQRRRRSTAASTPTFANTREPAATTPPASTAAARPTAIGLVNPTPGIPERQQQPPGRAPTTIPSDTLPASAGTSHSAGTRTRHGHADDHRTPTARVGDARRRPEMLGEQGTEARPSRVNPTIAGANATIGASASVRPEPGPSTNTRATGTAVATSRAAPSHAITPWLGPFRQAPGRRRLGRVRRRRPREAQLQQRSRQHGVREQVDGICPGEPRQGTLITGLLRRPVDQQHAELLQHQADDAGRGDRHDHRSITSANRSRGRSRSPIRPEAPACTRPGQDTQCRAPARAASA